MNKILQAAEYARIQHNYQLRKYTNAPFITHPARVAGMVSWIPMDLDDEEDRENLVCIAWLHDTIEDCNVEWTDIWSKFGTVIADGVQSLTNVPKDGKMSRQQRVNKNIEKLSRERPAIKCIKMCDRIDNLLEMRGSDPEFHKLYKQEGLQLAEALEDANEYLGSWLRMLCDA